MEEENFNPRLKKMILDVVSNQIWLNNPPETKQTFQRLIKDGLSNPDELEF